MKSHLKLLLLCLMYTFNSSCGDEVTTKKSKTEPTELVKTKTLSNRNLNISFLLDLSDRIDTVKYPNESMQYYKRDIAYIQSVSEAFVIHLQNKKVRQMNEKIQIFFDPEPKNPNINNISRELKFEVSRANASIELLDKIQTVYASAPKEIYNLAIADNRYIGSDTWRFFKSKAKDFCIEQNFRNILIVLTDGYIYHENSIIKDGNKTTYLTPQTIRSLKLDEPGWKAKVEEKGYGFLKATENLDNLEILVLGINPDPTNAYEEDIIIHYWSEWFDSMGIDKYEIKTADLPSNLNKIIQDFILN